MAFYYVKSGGTATGDAGRETTARTGAFGATSTYYDSIYDVFTGAIPTTAPVAGDEIYCSHLHNKTYTSSTNLMSVSNTVCISVDDANQENHLAGAKESTSGTSSSLTLCVGNTKKYAYYGMSFISTSHIFFANGSEVHTCFYDCLFELATALRNLYATGDGHSIVLYNPTFTFSGSTTTNSADNRYGNHLTIIGGSITTASTMLVRAQGDAGSVTIIDDFDASAMASSAELINIDFASDDNVYAKVSRCELPTGGVICTATNLLPGLNAEGNSLKVGTGGSKNHLQAEYGSGSVTDDTAIYRTAGSAFEDTVNFSIDLTTNADASYDRPLRYKVATFYVDTNDYTSTIDFKLHYARDGSSVAYNDDDLWFDIDINDGADDGLGATITNKINPFVTGAAPTTETSLWTGLGGTNKQMSETITATIGSSAGNIQTGIVTVWANFAVASDTAFIDAQPELS